ncbi:MAG: 6-carboxytetrahydropterin synthase [Candidatus Caenarcaniphilales bacterium]|nr:6-carboxytetrahydropterin synthase [Candidatus Caenarcaniphilales bacterium]
MAYTTTIELFKEDMKFSAGHFTVFSATERERLHGHNFFVRASIDIEVEQNGMAADYNVFKKWIRNLCNSLDEYFIIPELSPYLNISKSEDGSKLTLKHNQDDLVFYTKDVKLLPISNTTIEEFSRYFVQELCKNKEILEQCKVQKLEVKVSSGAGQWGGYVWSPPIPTFP